MPSNTRFEVADSHEITDVWAGQAGGFDLYTEGEQFVLRWKANRTKDSHTDRDAPRTSTLELYQVR